MTTITRFTAPGTCVVVDCDRDGNRQAKAVWIGRGDGAWFQVDPVPYLVLCRTHEPRDERPTSHVRATRLALFVMPLVVALWPATAAGAQPSRSPLVPVWGAAETPTALAGWECSP